MAEYRVTFTRIGRNHNVPPLETGPVDGPNHLAERIYEYARPHLMSRDVRVVLEDDGQSGWIFCGFHTGGTFTIETVGDDTPVPPPAAEPDCWISDDEIAPAPRRATLGGWRCVCGHEAEHRLDVGCVASIEPGRRCGCKKTAGGVR